MAVEQPFSVESSGNRLRAGKRRSGSALGIRSVDPVATGWLRRDKRMRARVTRRRVKLRDGNLGHR